MRFFAILVLFLGLLVGGQGLCRAAEGAVGVIDVNIIFAQSDAAKSIDAQREALRQEYLAEISKSENELRQEEQALAHASKDTSQEEYAKRRMAYEQKLNETRKMAQEKKRALEEVSSQAMDRLRDQLYLVAQEIANERGFSLVISNRDVIAGEKSLDITEETLKRLNERLPKVDLKAVTKADGDRDRDDVRQKKDQ